MSVFALEMCNSSWNDVDEKSTLHSLNAQRLSAMVITENDFCTFLIVKHIAFAVPFVCTQTHSREMRSLDTWYSGVINRILTHIQIYKCK